MFYQGRSIDCCTHVPGTVAQSSYESKYKTACTTVMDILHFSMINNDLMNEDTDAVPYQAPLITLYRKSAVFMANNGEYTKHTRHISRRMHYVRNVEEFNMHNKLWC